MDTINIFLSIFVSVTTLAGFIGGAVWIVSQIKSDTKMLRDAITNLTEVVQHLEDRQRESDASFAELAGRVAVIEHALHMRDET